MNDDINEILKKYYYNPETGFQSYAKLYKKVKIDFPHITIKQVKDFIKDQESAQVYSRNVKPQFNQTLVAGFGCVQMDLLDLNIYKGHNNRYRYILLVVDIYSRMLFALPLRTKGAKECFDAFISIRGEFVKAGYDIVNVVSDYGSEFKNKYFLDYYKENDIKAYYKNPDVFSGSLGIVDRMCATIRLLLNKYFIGTNTFEWVSVLPKLVSNINSSFQRTIKAVPIKIWEGDELNNQEIREPIKRLSVGDTVRVLNNASVFNKKHLTRFSQMVYKIEAIDGLGYRLVGLDRKYFDRELMKVSGNSGNVVLNRRGLLSRNRRGNRLERVRRMLG